MGKIPSIETAIFRAPTSTLRQIQNVEESQAPRGGAQPAAACQTTKPAQQGAGGPDLFGARKQRGEVRTAGLQSVASCWRSQLETGPRVAQAAAA